MTVSTLASANTDFAAGVVTTFTGSSAGNMLFLNCYVCLSIKIDSTLASQIGTHFGSSVGWAARDLIGI